MPLVTMGAIMGGNVRVGLEDSLYLGKGQLAKTNAEQVTRIRTILETLSLEIASADEARSMLAAQRRRCGQVLGRAPMIDKRVESFAAALAGIKDGDVLLCGGFGAVGEAFELVER